jgi:hypothetical protein
MPSIYSANKSTVLVDGEPVDNVQSLAFRIITEREDIRGIGSDERLDVSFGLRTVRGELLLRSASVAIDTLLTDRAKFQLVATLASNDEETARTYSFDDCYIEDKSFDMPASGTATTLYVFTATRVREE